jgi:protein O-mannosyl-transferase
VFWPGDLAIYYPFPPTFSGWSVAGAVLLLVGATVTALCLARRWPYIVVGWLWYLVTLLPVIGLIQLAAYSHADRYTYVPLIGVFLGLTWGACDLTRHWRYQALALSVLGAAAIVLCLVFARQQIGYWKDSETLFRHALAVTQDNWMAHNNLGNALDKKGQFDEAIRQYQEAIRLEPDNAQAHNNLGIAFYQLGRAEDAIRQFEEALRLKPGFADARRSLDVVLASKANSPTPSGTTTNR